MQSFEILCYEITSLLNPLCVSTTHVTKGLAFNIDEAVWSLLSAVSEQEDTVQFILGFRHMSTSSPTFPSLSFSLFISRFLFLYTHSPSPLLRLPLPFLHLCPICCQILSNCLTCLNNVGLFQNVIFCQGSAPVFPEIPSTHLGICITFKCFVLSSQL